MKKIFVLGLSIALSSCGSLNEPSQKDIREAMINNSRISLDRLLCFNISVNGRGEGQICASEYMKKYKPTSPSETMSFSEFQALSDEERNVFKEKQEESLKALLTDISKGLKKEGECQTISRDGSPIDIEKTGGSNGDGSNIYYQCNITIPVKVTNEEKEEFIQKYSLENNNIDWADRLERVIKLQKIDSKWMVVSLSTY